MNGLEHLKLMGKIVATVIRNKIDVKEDLSFFSLPQEPFQIAIHNHFNKKETNIHHNKVQNPIQLSQKQKYIYIIKGRAIIELSQNNSPDTQRVLLQKGDCIIIKDVMHRVIFSPHTKAIEIKQGPYNKNEESGI